MNSAPTTSGNEKDHPNLVLTRKYLRITEAEVYAHVSRTTLWRWNKKNRLPFFRRGGNAWVRISDLDSVIERGSAFENIPG